MLEDDNDDDDDDGGGGGGGGDIALSCPWRSCQLLLSKLLFIKLPQCGHLRRNFDPQNSIKKAALEFDAGEIADQSVIRRRRDWQ